MTNNQSVTLVINSISIGGTNPGDFSQTDTCGIAIAAFANCTVSVKFTPATTGTRTATLMISDSPDSASPHNIDPDRYRKLVNAVSLNQSLETREDREQSPGPLFICSA